MGERFDEGLLGDIERRDARIKDLQGLCDNLEKRAEAAEAGIVREREVITRFLVEHRNWADESGRLPDDARFAVVAALNAAIQFCAQRRRAAGVPACPTIGPACPRGGEIVDYCIGLCSCGLCPTPRPDWSATHRAEANDG